MLKYNLGQVLISHSSFYKKLIVCGFSGADYLLSPPDHPELTIKVSKSELEDNGYYLETAADIERPKSSSCRIVKSFALMKEFLYCREHDEEADGISGCRKAVSKIENEIDDTVKLDPNYLWIRI